jgi:hypothetical protein
LLVLVIVDQFRPDYLEAAAGVFQPGGFRRLFEKGAYFPDCRHLASTFPATTIATLATGAWPAQHGIVADSWYDRSIHKPVPATDEALLATTLAAQAVAARTRVTVVSLNEQHGALFAGTPDARLYWMEDSGRFAAAGDAPEWLPAFNATKNPESLHDARWQAFGAKPDAPALRILNFSPARPAEFLTLYKSSPWAVEAQFDLALEIAARDKLGQGSSLDLLCIVTGSTGLLGYDVGANLPLMRQMTLHIDKQLESLLNQLTKAPGEKNFSVVVAGAHGAPPDPAPDWRDRMAVNGEPLAQTVDRSLNFSGSGRVEKYLYPFLYLDTAGFRDPEPLREAAARAALEHPAVASYYTAGGACSTHDDWERRFRNSFHAQRSGDVMLSYHPECVEDYGPRGISYGSLYNYDARVPLLFYGPQFRSGVFEGPVESVDVAPTLARAMGVAAPSSSTGRVLGEALIE